jgi:hypothetical protein
MIGTWSGSDIKHSASGNDFSAPWFNNRNIQRFNTNYAGKAAQTAFKAELTGGYDDFHTPFIKTQCQNQSTAVPMNLKF